jgi:RNA polymerase sigma-70 factor (ECF subfamily)
MTERCHQRGSRAKLGEDVETRPLYRLNGASLSREFGPRSDGRGNSSPPQSLCDLWVFRVAHFGMVDDPSNLAPRAHALAPAVPLTELVRDAAAGSERAWTQLVRAYAPRLYALVYSRVRNATAAEDIAQSVLTTVAIKLRQGSYAEEGRFESWLFRIAMNRVRDHVRSQKRRGVSASIDAVEEPQASQQQEVGADHAVLSQRLSLAMQELSDADREVIELRHHGGMSFPDMAEVLGEPLGTLLARHHRALAKLKAILERPPNAPDHIDGTGKGSRASKQGGCHVDH